MTAVAVPGLWLPELWTPGKGWAPRLPKRFDRTVWRKAKEDTVVMAAANVQGGANNTGAATALSSTVTLGSTPTVGNMLIACVGVPALGAGTISMTNNAGQSWTSILSGSTTSTTWAILATIVGSSPSTTCQANVATAKNFGVSVCEYSGMGATFVTDGSNAAQASSSFQVASGNVTTTNADDLMIGFSYCAAGGATNWNAISSNPGGSWATSGAAINGTSGTTAIVQYWQEVLVTGAVTNLGARVGLSTSTMASVLGAVKNSFVPFSKTTQRRVGWAATVGRASNR